MVFFKKIVLVLSFFLSSVWAFSPLPKTVQKEDFATIVTMESSCYAELGESIKKILDISSLKLPKQIFKEDSYLHITNQKLKPFHEDDPMQGYEGAHKIFLLHIKDSTFFISLVDSSNRALKSFELKECK